MIYIKHTFKMAEKIMPLYRKDIEGSVVTWPDYYQWLDKNFNIKVFDNFGGLLELGFDDEDEAIMFKIKFGP